MLGEDRKELQSFCILALQQYITSENIFRISMVWSRNIRTKHTVQHTTHVCTMKNGYVAEEVSHYNR